MIGTHYKNFDFAIDIVNVSHSLKHLYLIIIYIVYVHRHIVRR